MEGRAAGIGAGGGEGSAAAEGGGEGGCGMGEVEVAEDFLRFFSGSLDAAMRRGAVELLGGVGETFVEDGKHFVFVGAGALALILALKMEIWKKKKTG